MAKEIQINFPGFYQDCEEKSKQDDSINFNELIENNFIQLNSINSQLTMCIKRLREGNDLLVEKSIHKDVEHVREEYKNKMDNLKTISKIQEISHYFTIRKSSYKNN